MVKPPKDKNERSPAEAERVRDAILKRMLQTKPKLQKDLVAERRGNRAAAGRTKKDR